MKKIKIVSIVLVLSIIITNIMTSVAYANISNYNNYLIVGQEVEINGFMVSVKPAGTFTTK